MEKIKDLPHMERPREKLQTQGAEVLSDAELLAIVFGSGTKGIPVLQLCDELLVHTPLRDLPDADVKQLSQTKGIGEAKALVLMAIVELSKRLHTEPLLRLADDAAVAEHVRPILNHSDGLSYLLLMMTADRELLAICELGSLLPDLPRIIRLATEAGAKHVQLVRNGWPQVGRLEHQFMGNLELACGTLGIIVHDFLIPRL